MLPWVTDKGNIWPFTWHHRAVCDVTSCKMLLDWKLCCKSHSSHRSADWQRPGWQYVICRSQTLWNCEYMVHAAIWCVEQSDLSSGVRRRMKNKWKLIRGGNVKAVCVIARDGVCLKVALPRLEHLLVNYSFLSPLKWQRKIKYTSLIITSTAIREEQWLGLRAMWEISKRVKQFPSSCMCGLPLLQHSQSTDFQHANCANCTGRSLQLFF